jgi:polysaccharide deacetylase family protein (PEP-CTERM system associated)
MMNESDLQVNNGLSIDVEDYFHAEVITRSIGRNAWDSMESRVVRNTSCVLDLLSQYDVRATFFILGWVAEHFPELVREIYSLGHEIGCHSFWHRLIYELSPEEFRKDTRRAKDVIESTVGARIIGYRAPSFSITKRSQWALKILSEEGFEYDSSIFPIRHDLYGIPEHPRFRCQHGHDGDWKIEEFPISTWRIGSINLPFGGGGYLRILPLAYTRQALRGLNMREGQPAIIYFHPWEIDPAQPRLSLSLSSRFRHYTNLEHTKARIASLLQNYKFVPLRELLAAC